MLACVWQGLKADVSILRATATATATPRASYSASRSCRKCASASVSKAPRRDSRSAYDVAVREQQILERELHVFAALEGVEVRDVGAGRDLRRARVARRLMEEPVAPLGPPSFRSAPRCAKIRHSCSERIGCETNPCVPDCAVRKSRASKLRILSSDMPVSAHTTARARHQHKRGAVASFASAGFQSTLRADLTFLAWPTGDAEGIHCDRAVCKVGQAGRLISLQK